MKRRTGMLLALAGIVVACWYLVRFEGEPQPVAPLRVVPLVEAPVWQAQPMLLQHSDEPAAVYIVSGMPGPDGLFSALRLDMGGGTSSSARIRFGPDTRFLPFDSAEITGVPAIELRGLAHRRPTPHLFRFPEPGGPGIHFVDSATGVLHVVAGSGNGRRTLLTINLLNSSRLAEIRSQLWSNRSRRLAAFLWRGPESWNLYLFSLTLEQR